MDKPFLISETITHVCGLTRYDFHYSDGFVESVTKYDSKPRTAMAARHLRRLGKALGIYTTKQLRNFRL